MTTTVQRLDSTLPTLKQYCFRKRAITVREREINTSAFSTRRVFFPFLSLFSSFLACVYLFFFFLLSLPSPFSRYMKYLYPYECEKRRLSTPAELQAAIDGNRREGRRSSYGTYAASGSTTSEGLVQRNPHTPNSLALHAQMSPLSLVTAVAAGGQHHGSQSLVNGSAAHTPLPHHPHHPQHSQGLPGQQPPNAG